MRNDIKAYSSFFQLSKNTRGRYKHNLTHPHHFTMMSGLLFPMDIPWEVLPGDTFSVKQRTIVRASNPLPTPVMDTLTMTIGYWYCPYRILYPGFDKFIMNVVSDGTGSNYIKDLNGVLPYYNTSKLAVTEKNGLLDYLGVPGNTPLGPQFSILGSEAYYKIWNRWWRYESLQPEVLLHPTATSIPYDYTNTPTHSYSNCLTNYVYGSEKDCLCPVNRKADVFSRCLPAPARGEDVLMDLSVPQSFTGSLQNVIGLFGTAPGGQSGIKTVSAQTSYDVGTAKAYTIGASSNNDLLVGFSNLHGGTINALVNAFAIYKLKEIDAQYGSRINEWTIGHYGVNVPDSRVQEPELLALHEFDLNINQITQTSKTDSTDYLGSVGAQSITNDGKYMFTKSFNEFGLILCLGCIRVKHHSYSQGIPFALSKLTRFQFYFNELANVPDQPLYKRFIYNNPNNASDVFGYQEPWFEYKHMASTVSGMMRPQYSGSYDMWTFTDEYSTVPSLSASWMYEDPSNVDRVLYVTQDLATPGFLVDCGFFVDAYRQVPLHSNPASLKGVL